MSLKRKKICNYLLFLLPLLLLFFAPGHSSGEGALKQISLKEATNTALRNNLDYKIGVKKQKAAEEKINAVWSQLMPVLESEASLVKQNAENGFMSLTDGQYDIKVIQLRFVINPGIFLNSLQLSRKAYKTAVEEVRRIKSEVTYNVIKSYFSLLLAKEMIKLRKDSILLLQENLKDVENQYKTGSVPKFELLQAQVRLKSQEPLLLEVENRYRVGLDIFHYHLGSEVNRYMVDSSILYSSEFKIPGEKIGAISKSLSLIALKNRPEIIQLKMKKSIAEHRKNINRSFYLWPRFSIGGYYGMTKYLSNSIDVGITGPEGSPDFSRITGDREWQNIWQVRVAATYRWGALLPFESSSVHAKEEKINIQQAEVELLKLKRLIAISIKSNYSELLTSYYTIISRKENLGKAEEGLRIARESYRAGVIKNSELLAAQFALTEAQTGYVNSINRYYLSIAALQKEMGVDDENIIFGGK